MPKKNRLAQEKSPYLLQHAANPVDWFPWGEEAFAKAKAENKPIFLSIGYSTCYWCHVMERECFEKEDVAEALRRDFVSVKVDREEHPEVDEIYMDAVLAMTGRGGWPMSVFLTPDLRPFWGGTYLPHPHFLQILGQIGTLWRESPQQIHLGGEKLASALREEEPQGGEEAPVALDAFLGFVAQAETRFDPVHGGFGPAPKFPSSFAIRLLLRLHRDQGDPKLLEMAERSLEAMACGGIFDQVGGGFHRYSTDELWLVPHFEKMLYDNALLVPAYLEAFQLTGKQLYADVARETLDYLLRDLRAPGGAFYAAEDAGEVDAEGEFYVWKLSELEKLLGGRFEAFRRVFPLSAEGNFEHGTNILHLADPRDWSASRSGEPHRARNELRAARAQRNRPHRDEKILTSWNGLALSAFALGARVLGDEAYLRAAEECAAWIRTHLWKGQILLRRAVGEDCRLRGTAGDYAFLIQGLISLYEASSDSSWLLWARELQEAFDRSFLDEKHGGYFTAAAEEAHLFVRKKDRTDGALPSPNSVAYGNLLRLAQLFLDPELEARAKRVLEAHASYLQRAPFALGELLRHLHFTAAGSPLFVLAGPKDVCLDLLRGAGQSVRPELLIAFAGADPHSSIPALAGKGGKEVLGYLCARGACQPPRGLQEILATM